MNPKQQAALEKAKIEGENIKMMVSDPSLKGKIATNITEPNGTVYWYIRFNTPLDADSVTKYTMNVTDMSGYIINVIITYDSTRNLIVLNPMDLYRQNEYYLLNISKKVRSDKGRPLTRPVHIMFKIAGDRISEFRMLKDTTAVPKPRKKPESMRRAEITELMAVRAQESGEGIRKIGKPTLPYGPIFLHVQLAMLGTIWLVFSFFFNNFYVTLGGVSLMILGLIHIIAQLFRKRTQSAINYAIGVMRFNSGKYYKAERSFEKAYSQDADNELAKYAIGKVQMFLD